MSGATGLSGGAQPVVEEVMVKKVTNLSSIPDHLSPEDNEEVPMNPQLDQRYVYSLKDFQPFESITYDGEGHLMFLFCVSTINSVSLHPCFHVQQQTVCEATQSCSLWHRYTHWGTAVDKAFDVK